MPSAAGGLIESVGPAELGRLQRTVLAAVRIATKCGYAISSEEILLLLPTNSELDEAGLITLASNDLHELVRVRRDLLVLKGSESLFSERERRKRASDRAMRLAEEFISRLSQHCPYITLAAVSGSVAYKNSRELDDIDLFLVTRPRRLWLTLFKALVLSRAYNLKGRILGRPINFCICYAVDKEGCEREMSTRRTPLIAREILTIHPIVGANYHELLIRKYEWVKAFFPRLFVRKLGELNSRRELSARESDEGGGITSADLFLFYGMRIYLLAKATLRNLRFRREGRVDDIFSVKASTGACIYSSRKYQVLEDMHHHLVM